ncbi:MAG: FxsA family protein [Caryophanon sp.]|nr:FxsA family protein [Caryophanon sp.]
MLKKLGVALIGVTLAEIVLLLLLGNQVGILWTVFIMIATGILGAVLAKKQGFQAIRNLQGSLQSGQAPGPAALNAACVLIGAIILILPGFLTDIIGLIFVLPFTRKFVQKMMYKSLRKQMKNASVVIVQR